MAPAKPQIFFDGMKAWCLGAKRKAFDGFGGPGKAYHKPLVGGFR